MSSISVREFLQSTSHEDETDPLFTISNRFSSESIRKDSQWLLRRHDTIFDHEYRYRSDHCVYPGVRPHFVNIHNVIVMVGLPARGKTYIARKLCRYLNWGGICAKVVSVGQYRREAVGPDITHEFFRKNNVEAEKIRLQSYEKALQDGAAWLKKEDRNKILILDATNTTKKRRKFVYDFCEENQFQTFFIESICDDPEIIKGFIQELKIYSPDYVHIDQEKAAEDFKLRLQHYEETYQEISDKCELERTFSYIKIMNGGRQYLVNNINGYLQSHVVYYLMNIHAQSRSLYVTVHGECEYNVMKELGGHSGLTETGKKFAKALQQYVAEENLTDLRVWTSSLTGNRETASYIPQPSEVWRALDYLDYGECHGAKFSELAERFPGIFTNSKGPLDLHWRYPSGESYQDLLSRLEPVIMELERQHNVLVISHRTTVRCLMAYFLDHNPDEVAHIRVPLHTVFKLTPVAYGCRVEKVTLNDKGTLS